MKLFDRMTARLRARKDRRELKAAWDAVPQDKRRHGKVTARQAGPSNRASRRRDLRYAGPAARRYRLATHMRRPLVAGRCRGKHKGAFVGIR